METEVYHQLSRLRYLSIDNICIHLNMDQENFMHKRMTMLVTPILFAIGMVACSQ